MKMKRTTPLVLTAGTTSKASKRKVMNGKPVLIRPAKTIISDSDEFREKSLCEDFFKLGVWYAYSPPMCYMGSVLR
jgi:hypothetical protein